METQWSVQFLLALALGEFYYIINDHPVIQVLLAMLVVVGIFYIPIDYYCW